MNLIQIIHVNATDLLGTNILQIIYADTTTCYDVESNEAGTGSKPVAVARRGSQRVCHLYSSSVVDTGSFEHQVSI